MAPVGDTPATNYAVGGSYARQPDQPALDDLYSRLVRTRERLGANNSTLDSIVNRIVGPEPSPNPPEVKRPSPPTITDLLTDIEGLVQIGEYLAQRAHRAIGLP